MSQFGNETGQEAVFWPDISDEMLCKVGRAVGQIAHIREACRDGLATMATDEERQELVQRAERAALSIISKEGLSVTQYNLVVSAADKDPTLERRLLATADSA